MEPKGSLFKLPFPEYLSLPYMSVHGLKLFSEDPIAYLLSFQNTKGKSTPALDQGKAFHCRILTPELYYGEVAESPDVPKRSDAQKKYWAEFEAVNNGKVILSNAIIQEIEYMAASVAANPRAVELLSGGQAEMTGVWEDDRGFMCKIRTDYIKFDEYNGIADISDLKSFSGDLGGGPVGRDITNRFYHWQDYFYCKGIKNIYDIDQVRFHFIFVSKQWPYRTRVFTIHKDKVMTETGERIEAILDDYGRFMQASMDSLFAQDDSEILYLPPWAA